MGAIKNLMLVGAIDLMKREESKAVYFMSLLHEGTVLKRIGSGVLWTVQKVDTLAERYYTEEPAPGVIIFQETIKVAKITSNSGYNKKIGADDWRYYEVHFLPEAVRVLYEKQNPAEN